MGFFDKSKTTNYLPRPEPMIRGGLQDPDEPSKSIGSGLVGTARNVERRESRREGGAFVPFTGKQAIDGETLDGINVREIFTGGNFDSLGGKQDKGSKEGRF